MARLGWESLGLEILRTGDFEGRRLHRTGTYAVCFGATWCGPTRWFAPRFAACRATWPARLAIADITSLEDPLWDRFEIRITPTVMAFADGAVIVRIDGRRFIGLRDADLDRFGSMLQDALRAAPPERSPTGPP
jgi:hypothetical protein